MSLVDAMKGKEKGVREDSWFDFLLHLQYLFNGFLELKLVCQAFNSTLNRLCFVLLVT